MDDNIVITIDPGFNTGVAVWRDKELVETKCIKEDAFHRTNICDRLLSMSEDLDTFFMCWTDENIKLIIIEGVYLFPEALRSITSIKRGNLFTLAYLIGMYLQVSFAYTNNVEIILAREWKGQLPDAVIKRRVNKILGLSGKNKLTNQHICDAVGIGLNRLGLL